MLLHRLSLSSALALLVGAACFGIITLERAGLTPQLRPVTTTLYEWTLLLAGFALLLGIANVALVHLRRILAGQRDWLGSLLLLTTLCALCLAGLLDPAGSNGFLLEWFFDAVIWPGQATLFALLAFFTATAAYRYLRLDQRGGGWMLAGALLMLIAQLPGLALSPELQQALGWFLDQPVAAIFRGVLLGSALALVLIGIRFLLGRTEV
jgi:hypothetical protein